MNRHSYSDSRPFICLLVLASLLCFSTTVGFAQVIHLKTAPVATGSQFLLQPPPNLGMGGLTIALDDIVADPFVNPAKTRKLNGTTTLYTLPTFYRITNGHGSARTLAVGGLTANNSWFGGLGVAVQEMNQATSNSNLLKEESTNNNYVWALAGRELNSSVSLGAGLFWAGLNALDGVDLLYPRSERIEQSGYMLDLRVGLNGETPTGGQYEAIALFSRTDMTHEVTYRTWNGWRAASFTTSDVPQSEIEENLDITNTWGLHAGYDQPVGVKGWKLGGIVTFNYKTHPKIPNYELMNIPRDPGNTWAFNIGFGTSTTSDENVTFGVDLIFEPVWSNTWVDALENIRNEDETEILVRQGDKTIENEFEFMNSVLKTGLGWKGNRTILQAGVLTKTYRYRLKQQNYIEDTSRRQRESWTEWTFSYAIGWMFPGLEIRYTGLVTTGTGQPGLAGTGGGCPNCISTGSGFAGDFIFAPSGDLALESATVWTHQIGVRIPIEY